MQRRFPSAQVVLYPAVVQGEKAAKTIIKQIQRIDKSNQYDTLIVGRGGGSIEDLWAFNDEMLARTVAELSIPVVSSVGHETDNTLIDFVADHRAATPTAAAELATPVTLTQLITRLNELQVRLQLTLQQQIDVKRQRVARVANHVIFQQPDRLYVGYNQRVDQLRHDLEQLMQQHIVAARHRLTVVSQRQSQMSQQILQQPREKLQLLAAKLDSMSPLKILVRGFVVMEKEQQVVKSIQEIAAEDQVNLRLSDGVAKAKIIETSKLTHE